MIKKILIVAAIALALACVCHAEDQKLPEFRKIQIVNTVTRKALAFRNKNVTAQGGFLALDSDSALTYHKEGKDSAIAMVHGHSPTLEDTLFDLIPFELNGGEAYMIKNLQSGLCLKGNGYSILFKSCEERDGFDAEWENQKGEQVVKFKRNKLSRDADEYLGVVERNYLYVPQQMSQAFKIVKIE